VKTYTTVRGMHDIFPDKLEKWQRIENKIKKTAELFGFEEIRTPIVEKSSLFERSVGSSTDIVEKEMYTFFDKKERKIALRPEATASVVRAYIQSGADNIQKISRYYYYGPMFRYDRPQKGRYRQFYQFGVELFGGNSALFDGEIIKLLYFLLLKEINVTDPYFKINSTGCVECKNKFSLILKNYLENQKTKLCTDCQKRIETGILRVLDCKNKTCKEIIKNGPNISNYLCGNCKNHFDEVKNYLNVFNVPYNVDTHLVRGLDYYTRTVFESFVSQDDNAIAAGGRYDNLVEELGGHSVPAVGFAIGMERVIEKSCITGKKIPFVYGVFLGEKAQISGAKLSDELRENGISVKTDHESRNLKAYLKAADKASTEWCIIIGENELKENQVILKNMKSGIQELLDKKTLIAKLKKP